jgi:hypothetical protein
MNPARWVVAYHMQLEKERRFIRRLARFFGTDMALAREGELQAEFEFGEAPEVFPLAGLLNPESYSKFMETETETATDEVAEAEYEKQVAAMEKAGQLSDIDLLSDTADDLVKAKKLGQLDAILDQQGKGR